MVAHRENIDYGDYFFDHVCQFENGETEPFGAWELTEISADQTTK